MTVYENIRKVAKARGLSLQEVATKSGLSPNMIYQYKNVNPKMDTIRAIAKTLNVSVDYLLGNTDEMHTQSKLVSDADLEAAFEGAESFDGKPLTEHDKRIMKNLLISYMESKD